MTSKHAGAAPLKLVSWNINSVRLRHPNIAAFTEAENADILCLQEIKCQTDEFPEDAFRAMGYEHFAVSGQKGGHYGVAIASRVPLEILDTPDFCREGHARVNAVQVAGITLHNIYLPAGGDVPDPVANEKFAHKLDFMARMKAFYAAHSNEDPLIIVGDLNVAPHEHDVWGHKQLLKIVSHTPIETDAMTEIIAAGGFTDIARASVPETQKLYSWWSYRAKDWAKSNRGRRLDHIWSNPGVKNRVDPSGYRIHLGWRGGWKPSDHAPISVLLDLAE